MSEETNQLANIGSFIDKLTVPQTSENNNHDSEKVIISQLYTELYSFDDNSLTSSTFDTYEEYFIKLTRLLPTSSTFSSSPSLIGCCLIILEKLLLTGYLTQSMESNQSKSNEYYTLAMDALNIKENLDYLQMNSFATDLYKTFTRLYMYLARETIRCRNRASELLTVEQWNLHRSFFDEKSKSFLKILLSFIDKTLHTNEELTPLIGFFISAADDMNLIPDLVECQLPQHVKYWLTTYINNKELEDHDLCQSILVIINNTARHEQGSNILKDIQIIETLQEFWNIYEKNLSKDLIAWYYMGYALIVTPEQVKSTVVLHDVIDYLIDNINIASQSSNMRNDSAHISEYLVALARLIVNDNVAQYIINKTTDGLIFFNELLYKYNELTANDLYLKHLSRIALFNIFCSFSFQNNAQKILVVDKKFIDLIKKASEHQNNEHETIIQPSLLQHLLTVKQAAEGILINLDLYKDEEALVQTDTSSKIKHPHVMISYSHKDIQFCRNLVRVLKSRSIDVWVDEDGHCRSEDCWEEIARAIKYASFILVIVSPSYCQSMSCRKEATYADKRKKTLIAIYPNDDKYEPDEWLDIRLTGSYVRFGKNEKSFDDSISSLLQYIQPKDNEVINQILPKTNSAPLQQSHDLPKPIEIISPVVSQSTKSSIHDWTKQDVERWFIVERNLLPQLYKLYGFVDGDSLLEYAKHFMQEYEQDFKKQYEKLSQRLHKEFNIEFYDNNYTDLVCSMKKLVQTFDPSSLTTTKTSNQKSSSLCLIL